MIKPIHAEGICVKTPFTFGDWMIRKTPLFIGFLLLWCAGKTQVTYPVNGVHDERMVYHAFTNATIYATPSRKLDSATLLIRDGKVVEVGKIATLPGGTVVHDCRGLHIYPSFIDIYAGFNVKPTQKAPEQGVSPGEKPGKSRLDNAGSWNPAIRPEHVYEQLFPIDKKVREDWLASGIGIVNVHERDGIMRGSSQCFHLGIEKPNESLLRETGAQHFSFSRGSSESRVPSSFAGAVALIRQTFYDAQWYAGQPEPFREVNPSLEALNHPRTLRNIFELNHPLSARNVLDIAAEFEQEFILKGTGMEYLVLDELKPGTRLILPLDFPKAYDVKDPYDTRMVSLQQLKHWEAAPFNPYFADKAGMSFCLTRDTLRTSAEFLNNLRKVCASGLDHETVLQALTVTPADFLGLGAVAGTLEPGKLATFIITNKTFAERDFRVIEHWNKGALVYQARPAYPDMIGKYNLVIGGVDYNVTVSAVTDKGIKAEASVQGRADKLRMSIERDRDLLTIVLQTQDTVPQLLYRLSGKISLNGGIWDGRGQDAQGKWVSWGAVKSRDKADLSKAEHEAPPRAIPDIVHPNKAYGWDSLPAENTFVITDATVWTAGDAGILKHADIYVVDGKIKAVGKDMFFPTEVRRVGAQGLHVTPGIVDEHSHIGIRGGVNEYGQPTSAAVRMSDALDPWNINIYRQLAGGVTTAQLLHGSLNPIGGQSALVKFKWGMNAGDMLINDAPAFIKFALGENVKRSNAPHEEARFPLTRMGVEQVYADVFTRAAEYNRQLAVPAPKKSKKQPLPAPNVRRDLELEALSEVLTGKRFITCHSYVQSEILMLIALADSMGFDVNTFTHVLEGYKLSGELAKRGISASTFSDWWAYKYEVKDAIPYNAALLTRAGVNTGINSDDAEMGRRLNQEAAKSMKYGGLSEEEAIRLITINPARMLHLDHRIGSIEPGKDADLVFWNGNPLSVYASVEKTMIEGRVYFDAGKGKSQQEEIAAERARIINLMLQEKQMDKTPPRPEEEKHYHCDTVTETIGE